MVCASGESLSWIKNEFEQLDNLTNITITIGSYFFKESATFNSGMKMDLCADNLSCYLIAPEQNSIDTYYCKNRHCPICQWRCSRRALSKTFELLYENPELLHEKWMYITFTSRNCHVTELRQTMQRMNEAFQKLSMMPVWQSNVLGGIKFTKIDQGGIDPETAHLHFHCLLTVRPSMFRSNNDISQDPWAQLWQQCLHASVTSQVDVVPIKGSGNALRDQLARAVAYSTKPTRTAPTKAWFLEMARQVKSLKSKESFGIVRELLKTLPTQGADHPDLTNWQEPVMSVLRTE